MNTWTQRMSVLLALALAVAAQGIARAEDVDPPGRVARVNFTTGSVSLEPAGTTSWVADVANRPLVGGDKLWVDSGARAELHVGSTAVRLAESTGLEIVKVDDRAIVLRLSAGTAQIRLRTLGPEQSFEIDGPTAAVSLLRPGNYRLDQADGSDQLRVAVIDGTAEVSGTNRSYALGARQAGEFAGGETFSGTTTGLSAADAFDNWAAERDRREEHVPAAQYVSREVTGYEDLDTYGAWQSSPTYGEVWVPRVAAGWAPYQFGHWVWIAPWGWTWVDEAPWGFAPFHYGRWVSFGGYWGWCPGPRMVTPVYAPALVAWVGGPRFGIGIGVGPSVAWFPLGYNEVYVPGYHSSPRYLREVNLSNTYVTNTYITNNYINSNYMGERRADHGGPRYANQHVPGAVTMMPHDAFTGAVSVQRAGRSVSPAELARASIATAAPAIGPREHSFGVVREGAPAAAEHAWSRPTVARTPPPPARVAFAEQARLVAQNGGRPLASQALVHHAAPAAAPVRLVGAGGRAPERAPGAPAAARPAPEPGYQPRAFADRPPLSARPGAGSAAATRNPAPANTTRVPVRSTDPGAEVPAFGARGAAPLERALPADRPAYPQPRTAAPAYERPAVRAGGDRLGEAPPAPRAQSYDRPSERAERPTYTPPEPRAQPYDRPSAPAERPSYSPPAPRAQSYERPSAPAERPSYAPPAARAEAPRPAPRAEPAPQPHPAASPGPRDRPGRVPEQR